MTKISRGGGIFENFSARGGLLPEVSNFDTGKRVYLALKSNILSYMNLNLADIRLESS